MRIGSLFSGYGGLDLAVERYFGGTTAWHVEFDKHPSTVLAQRWPGVPNHGDITTVDWDAVEPVDILTGGFPCQDVSTAGLRKGVRPGTRSGLWEHFAYAIRTLRPRLVVIENVAGLLSADAHSDVEPCPWCVGDEPAGHMRALGAVLSDLAEIGFDAEWCSVRASDAGAPHRRERVFVLASRPGGVDAGYGVDGRTVRGRGLHIPADGQQDATHPAWHQHDRLGRDREVLRDGRGRDDTRAIRAAGVGDEADLSLVGYDQAASGDSPESDVAWTLLSPPAEGHRCDVRIGADGRVIVAADAAHNGLSRRRPPRSGRPGLADGGGDPDGLTLLPTPAVNDIRKLLEERSAEPDEFGCRIWTGWTNGSATAYGKFSVGGVKMYAHRAAYEAYRGTIPEGYEIDHLCQQPLCITPEHLDAVTPEENRSRVTQRRTHCKRGHEFTEENTYWIRPGARACRACRARQDKIQKQRKRGVPDDEIVLLPTPVTNDMGRGKTPQDWDDWTQAMRERHGNGNGHGKSLEIEAQRLLPTPTSRDGKGRNQRDDDTCLPGAVAQDFGPYTAAIARWEQVIGRPAPSPTEPSDNGRPRLSPRFVEHMMGLPDGWVTGVGIPRSAQLKALGNGVVPQQAALALSILIPRLGGAS